MKKRRTRTASAAELKRMKPKNKPKKDVLEKLAPFPTDDDIMFLSKEEPCAIYGTDGMIRRTTAGKIAEAVGNAYPPTPTTYSFTLKPTDVFNITVDGKEMNMSGQTLKEAFED